MWCKRLCQCWFFSGNPKIFGWRLPALTYIIKCLLSTNINVKSGATGFWTVNVIKNPAHSTALLDPSHLRQTLNKFSCQPQKLYYNYFTSKKRSSLHLSIFLNSRCCLTSHFRHIAQLLSGPARWGEPFNNLPVIENFIWIQRKYMMAMSGEKSRVHRREKTKQVGREK